MTGWVNVFEIAVLDMMAAGLNIELKSVGGHLFRRKNLTLERHERVSGGAAGEYDFAAIRSACQEQRSHCGGKSFLSVQSYVTKKRKTMDKNPQNFMILFRPGSILTRPVGMMNENKESPKDVRSSLGAHTC